MAIRSWNKWLNENENAEINEERRNESEAQKSAEKMSKRKSAESREMAKTANGGNGYQCRSMKDGWKRSNINMKITKAISMMYNQWCNESEENNEII